ncbi:GWxTD domain-containing protein, partial [bacterium]|nr:GWxTD domain-containing protein [bacterium]
NPSRRFGFLNPVLYVYFEIYGLAPAQDSLLSVAYSVENDSGRTVKSVPAVSIRTPGTSACILHGIDVSTLRSGVHALNVQVGRGSGMPVSLSRPFEILQMDYLSLQPRLDRSQAEAAGRILKSIASPAEAALYEDLPLAGKEQFLIRFWKRRDPTPGTPENEALEEVKRNHAYADAHFGWGRQEGWTTDRGRVLIQYGMPDEIDRSVFEAETKPYEVWTYQRERLYLFVFGDVNGNGQYILLHSNKEEEIRNENWLSLLRGL